MILDYTENNGLIYCNNPKEAKNNAERLYLAELSKLNAHAVLFRRYFKQGENTPYHSEPSVCIFQEDDITFNSDEHIQLHAALWSEGKNEIYIIIGNTRIDIINARKPAENDNGKLSIDNLILVSESIANFDSNKFSAHLFGSGTFWEQNEFKHQLNEKNSPHIHLLNYLMDVRKEFLNPRHNISLKSETIDKLLVVSILVKFLEEIKDADGTHTLREIYKKFDVNNFSEAVEKNYSLDIFGHLASKFNGEIFDNFSSTEKEQIKSANLNLLSQFLTGTINPKTKQYFLWKQYSFNHLPAEVISAIYENFIQAEAYRSNKRNEKGVIYTPIHLVNFLVDRVMPLEKAKEYFEDENFKILDPTCGSGVFLVAAFKRLLQWWAINNSSKNDIQYPDSETAQRILEKNIFGVDVKETAILVSVLGLTTALLDKLTPKEIWSNLKLKDLSEQNVIQANFFEWATKQISSGNSQFDLVIGNPPFNPETDIKKSNVLKPDFLQKIDLRHKKIPGNNFALHFFEGAMRFTKEICMILPSNAFLYNKANTAQDYREKLFTNYNFSEIYDFTHLRRDLFHRSADTPVIAVFATNEASSKRPIKHTVVKRMVSSENKIAFEIDHYDQHMVKWEWAIDNKKHFVWKSNLLGGGRLFQLMYRLSLLPSLKQYINNKMSENSNWIYSSGYKLGGKTKKKRAPFIEEGDKINGVSENGLLHISDAGEKINEVEYFPNPSIYQPPFIVFDQIIGEKKIPVSLIIDYPEKKYLYFNRDFVGIKAPKSDLKELKRIYDYVSNKYKSLYRLVVLILSGSCMILTETEINKRDLDSLPYPDNEDYLKLSESERVIMKDVLDYFIHLGKSIKGNSAGSKLFNKASKRQIEDYGAILTSELNSIYAKNNKSWQVGQILKSSTFTICQIGFGNDGALETTLRHDIENHLEKFINHKSANIAAVYKRVVRIYMHNDGFDCIYFIKPNTIRYWLKSVALRDADDTFYDLKSEGF